MMSAPTRLLTEYMLTYKAVVVYGIILTGVLAVLMFADYIVRDETVTWEGQCVVGEWKQDDSIGFSVDCGDKGETVVTSSSVVRSVMNDPGPLVCRQYLTDDIECDPRPKKEKKAE